MVSQFANFADNHEKGADIDIFRFNVPTDDKMTGRSGPIIMEFGIPSDFRYAIPGTSEGTPMKVTIRKEDSSSMETEVWVEMTGMIRIGSPDIPGLGMFVDGDRLDLLRMEAESPDTYRLYKTRRDYCKEVLYRMKSLLHTDTHHDPDSRDDEGRLEGPDDMCFSLSHEMDREAAVREFADRLILTVQNGLESLWTSYSRLGGTHKRHRLSAYRENDGMFHDHYCYLNGHITYGRAFLTRFLDALPEGSVEGYMGSLDNYRDSVDALYDAHINTDSHSLNSAIKRLTVITVLIGVGGLVLSVVLRHL